MNSIIAKFEKKIVEYSPGVSYILGSMIIGASLNLYSTLLNQFHSLLFLSFLLWLISGCIFFLIGIQVNKIEMEISRYKSYSNFTEQEKDELKFDKYQKATKSIIFTFLFFISIIFVFLGFILTLVIIICS